MGSNANYIIIYNNINNDFGHSMSGEKGYFKI